MPDAGRPSSGGRAGAATAESATAAVAAAAAGGERGAAPPCANLQSANRLDALLQQLPKQLLGEESRQICLLGSCSVGKGAFP